MNKTINLLKLLYKSKKITKQQMKTFRGQVLAGDEEGCLRGLKRMKLL